MLKRRVLWCFMIAACSIQSGSLDHQTDNELCKSIAKSNDDFSCKPINQCTTFIQADQQQRIYPKICRFHGRTPIVCCPTSRDIVDQNKFAEKCREYYSLTTNGGGSIDLARSCRPKRATENKVLTIVGGTVAEENEFPHMVILGFGKTIKDVEWSCGGSLISDLYILSAAHCSEIGNKGQIKWALLGDNDLGSGRGNADPQTREIIQRILHPDFYPPSVYNDIGLYRMDTPVQFNQFIMPICLNIEKEVIAKEAIAIGWGRTDSAGPTSNVLMKVLLDLVNQNECNHSYSASILEKKLAFGINPKSQICAGEMEGGKDTCQGDSGGPLQIVHAEFECMYTQIGITSFGKLCGQPNAPGVYTRVSNYISWIDSVVWPTTMSTP